MKEMHATATGRFMRIGAAAKEAAVANKAVHREFRESLQRFESEMQSFERLRQHVGLHALVVDDDQEVARALARLLRARGYVVKICLDAPAARTALQEREFAVAFIDQVLCAHESGLALAEEVRRTSPFTRLVMMSGFEEVVTRVREASGRLGAAFLSKPFTDDELRVALG